MMAAMSTNKRRFTFTFTASREFLRESPAAQDWVASRQGEIASRATATGPRGGLYELITPPDAWLMSEQSTYAFLRNEVVFSTHREGRYVRPDRAIRLLPDQSPSFRTLKVKAQDGKVILPDGRIVTTDLDYVDFPVLA